MKQDKIKYSVHAMILFGASMISNMVTAEVAPAGSYKVDPAHSSVLFSVNHLGFSELTGRFNNVEGEFEFNPKSSSKVNVTIKTESIDTNHAQRDKHLRSPDFLNVKQFPIMKFNSDKVTFDKLGQPVKIYGKLSLHGKTKPMTLVIKPVGAGKDPWGNYRSGYIASGSVKRSEFGMDFMMDGIGDKITITLNIEAIKN